MKTKTVSIAQAVSLYVLMIIGTSVIVGPDSSAKQDTWVAVLIGLVASLPFLLMQIRLYRLFPDQTMEQIIVHVLGKAFGKVIMVSFAIYSISLGAMVSRNISEFIETVSMPRTPQYFLEIAMVLLAIWSAKSGLTTMGRCAFYGVFPIAMIVILPAAIGLPDMKVEHILPVFATDFKTMSSAAFSFMSFPFMETLILGTQLYQLRKGQNHYKALYIGILIGGLLLALINVRNIAILGPIINSVMVFPGYDAVSVIQLGDFFTRFEAVATASLILCSFMKMSICLLVASKGVAFSLGVKDYRDVVVAVAMVILLLSSYMYDNIMQMLQFAASYRYYALPLQILSPLVLWIVAEIKVKKEKQQAEYHPEF